MAALSVALGGLALPVAAAEDDPVPGTGPEQSRMSMLVPDPGPEAPSGLDVVVNERGMISRSVSAVASSSSAGGQLVVDKPAGATVRSAYLAYATTGFTSRPLSSPLSLDGQAVPMTGELANDISSYNYLAEVTNLVGSKLDAAPAGPVTFTVVEPEPGLTEGAVIVVIYDDPAVTVEQSVTLLYGALSPTGDFYDVKLADPIDLDDPDTRLEMSLGISYSFQTGGVQQFSTVDVNDRRLTTSAGGEDDGIARNGGLITAGGRGDSLANPANPTARPSHPRSDDELYDLRPFVRDGDTSIQVATSNPSRDDNVFLATFTMNPPVTSIDTGEAFVHVALGDSYQSGEGVGNSIADDATYLAEAYENGSNYPEQVGPEENTYTDLASEGGNSCHRALANYAKLNRFRLEPGAETVLVDVTCSGAKIEAGGKPPIVGSVGGDRYDPDSQVDQAVERLASMGLDADDVDLVTVGMGGNDAKFGDIVAACLLPNVLRELVKAYPDAPGEVEFVVNRFATCQNADRFLFRTDAAVAELGGKERWAQDELVDTFGSARIMQLNYPNVLPDRETAPEWCGGIRKDDLPYANEKIAGIDAIINGSVGQTAGNYELVDIERLFGSNALCPSEADATLANGISEDAFRAELDRLLNVDGGGDAEARALLDDLVAHYNAYKACLAQHYNPFGADCDTGAAQDRLQQAGQALLAYLQSQQDVLLANLVESPSGGSDAAVRFDRSRGLFHPNANGFAVIACKVAAQYRGEPDDDCISTTSPVSDTVNGAPVANEPEDVGFGDILRLILKGYARRRPVLVTAYSQPTPMGSVVTDEEGRVVTNLELPDLNPGVHTIVFSGETPAGTSMRKTVRVDYPGRPSGTTYGTYLCCFDVPADGRPNPVTVSYLGEEVMNLVPDEDGGVLVEVPLLNLPLGPYDQEIEVRDDVTGQTLREVIRPVPSVVGLWATGSGPGAVEVTGNHATVEGLVHSDGGVRVAGRQPSLPTAVEYATRLDISGSAPTIGETRQVDPGGNPPVPRLSAYRPGGAVSQTRPADYHAVAASACIDGVWEVDADQVPDGIVYVPCGVALTGPGVADATLAAEGPVTVASRWVTISPPRSSDPAVLSGADIAVAGRDATLGGSVVARTGSIEIDGRSADVRCGAIAEGVHIGGTSVTITVDEECRPQ